jgi:hypothetical protein
MGRRERKGTGEGEWEEWKEWKEGGGWREKKNGRIEERRENNRDF